MSQTQTTQEAAKPPVVTPTPAPAATPALPKVVSKVFNNIVIVEKVYNKTVTPNEINEEAKFSIGSCLTTSGTVLNPLSIDEERFLMPLMLNISYADTDFVEQVREFWKEFTFNLEDTNKKELDAGYTEVRQGNDLLNLQVNNLKEFLSYKLAMRHPGVANDRDAKKNRYQPNIKLMLTHKADTIKRNEQTIASKTKLYSQLSTLLEDLRLGGIKSFFVIQEFKKLPIPSDLLKLNVNDTADNIILAFQNDAEKYPNELATILDTPNIEQRAAITLGIYRSILHIINDAYVYADVELGFNPEEAAKFLALEANSSLYAKLKGTLESSK